MVFSQRPALEPFSCLPWPASDLLDFLVLLIWPSQAALSGLVSLFMPTSIEQEDVLKLSLRRAVLSPLYATLFLLSLPVALVAIALRCLLSFWRRPFQFSVVQKAYIQEEEESLRKLLSSAKLQEHRFGIATANLCLLPEFLARINYLSHAGSRAKAIGERFVVDQFFFSKNPESSNKQSMGGEAGLGFKQNMDERDSVSEHIATHFPHLDFLCLQEVFDWNYNKLLRAELHKVFPYIVHDVGLCSLSSNYFLLNSGLLFASRHPVLAVDFRLYKHSISQCLLISKGLLLAKVQIGKETNSRRSVGYIFITHLQAYQGKEEVIVKQLDEVAEWTADFRKQTTEKNDVVLFDMLCGDLNFDNMSPGDKVSREHGLFDIYHDPCRLTPGEDQPWTVGTEFRQLLMHESMASDPSSLKCSIGDPVLRHRYLMDADITEQTMDSLVKAALKTDHHGNIVPFSEGGRRRIDYILTRKDTPVDIQTFHFVTRLASLSDHMPCAMTFKVKGESSSE